MGDPVTLGLAAGSAAISAASSAAQGQARADALEAQGKARQQRAEFQAEQQREQAEVQEQRVDERLRDAQVAEIQAQQRVNQRQNELQNAIAAQTAAAAASGISIGPGGSLGAIQRETREQAQRDITTVRFLGENQRRKNIISARNQQQTADNTRESARFREAFGATANEIAQQRAQSAQVGGFLQAGSTLLSAGRRASNLGGGGDFQSPSEFSGIQRPAPSIRGKL